MKRKKIAIIFGGCSSEYEVSLQSAYAVITHIDQEKYEMVLIGIDQTGVWYLYQGEHADIPSDNWNKEESCIPVVVSPDRTLHGILLLKETGIEYGRTGLRFAHFAWEKRGRWNRTGNAGTCRNPTDWM